MNGLSHQAVCFTLDDSTGNSNHKSLDTNGHTYYSQDGVQNYLPQTCPNGTSSGLESEGYEKRGVGLDFAILDSTFLLSQVFPSLFMGMIVQFTKSVTAYVASSAIFGAVGVYFATQVVFEQKDVKKVLEI